VVDVEVTGSVQLWFWWWQGFVCLKGGVGAGEWGCLHAHERDGGEVVATIVLQ